MASVWNDNIQFFKLCFGQIWNFRRIPAGTLSHLTYVGMSIRDSKNYPKSIVKYQSEDRKVSEGAMTSCQNGRKFARMYAGFGFGLLRFVCCYHYTISMLVYCTAMYKLCDCWKKNIKNFSFRRNQLCKINCICFFARPQEQTKLESWIHYYVIYRKWNIACWGVYVSVNSKPDHPLGDPQGLACSHYPGGLDFRPTFFLPRGVGVLN